MSIFANLPARFSSRTLQGAKALVSGLRATVDNGEYERITFLAVGEGAAWARLLSWPRVESVLTPLAPALLGLSVWRLPESRDRAYLRAALGSACVAAYSKSRSLSSPSIAGITGVMGQYAGYSSVLCRSGARPTAAAGAIATAAVLAGTAAAAKLSPRHVPAVLCGGAMAAATSALADDPSFRAPNAPAALHGISHGANLLFASEALTFARSLTSAGQPLDNRLIHRLVGAAEGYAHYLGHFLLVEGITRRA